MKKVIQLIVILGAIYFVASFNSCRKENIDIMDNSDDFTIDTIINCPNFSIAIDFAVTLDSFYHVVTTGGEAPFTYLWNTGQTDDAIHGDMPGIYEVSVLDANGCLSQASIEFVDNCVLNTSSPEFEGPDANGMYSITVGASGSAPPFQYLWSTGEMTNSINVSEAGDYIVTITDDRGCIIGTHMPLGTSPVGLCPLGIRLYQGSDGVLRFSFRRPGVSPHTYLWSDGSTGASISSPVIGTNYSLTITDAEGCMKTADIQL